MSDSDETEDDAPKKRSRKPLLIGMILALLGGGGGFYAVQSGLILGTGEAAETTERAEKKAKIGDLPDVAYVEVTPLVISVGDGTGERHLRFRAQLEVGSQYAEEVQRIMPRVVDVLNSYLNALEMRDLADSAALMRLRSQMLRRVQMVTGGPRVNDLLIMEFVLN